MSIATIPVTPGTGANVGVDTVGNNSIQFVKLLDATAGSSNAAIVGVDGALLVDINTGNITVTPSGNQTVVGPTADGSAAANPPVLIAGTADGTGTGTVSVLKVDTGGNVSVNVAAFPANITANVTAVPGNMTVNLNQVGGSAVVLGNNTAANSIPVTIATNQGVFAVNANITGGNVTATLPANITANVTAIVPNQTVVLTQIANTTILTGGAAGSQGVGGLAANNAGSVGNPLQVSAIAVNVEPTVATNGQNAALAVGLEHKLLILPYSNKENMVRGTGSIANTTANVTVIAAQGAGNKIYVTGLQASNTGNATVTITTNDSANSVFIVPSGGGSNIAFHTPLVTAANVTFAFTASANTTTLTLTAQGYFGT